MKWMLWVVAGLAAIVGLFFILNNYIYEQKQAPSDYKEATFLVGDQVVMLKGGVAEIPSPPQGSGLKTTIKYFGNNAKGDLNGDGIPDIAYLVTSDAGGNGVYFFAVGALQDASGRYPGGTHAVMIGQNIAPQTTEIRPDGTLIVNYGVKSGGTTMGKSLYLKFDPVSMQFGELVQNFEGESAR